MKVQTITTNFSAGEFSPELQARTDLEKYNASAKQLRNVLVKKEGGVTIRPPMMYMGAAKTNTDDVRLIPFIYSRTDAYVIEFGNGYIRFWKNGVLVLLSGSPYEIATPWTAPDDLDFTQYGDTMVLCAASVTPYVLKRYADNRWTLSAAPFDPAPMAEIGYRVTSASATISDVSIGTGRTVTASGTAFQASDVGRSIESADGGVATITGYTSGTVVTVTVTVAFGSTSMGAATWVVTGSPYTTCTSSAANPVGAAVTLTLGAAGWWSTDVGSYVEINGGKVEITGYTSATVVSGIIRSELTSAVASQAGAWAILRPIFNAYDGNPTTCTFYQQRLWFANTARYPQGLWGSTSGLYFNFAPGTLDDSAIYKTVASDDSSPIQFISSGKSLLIHGYAAEFDGYGGIEKPATMLNMHFTKHSEWGAEHVRPVTVGGEVMFAERGGKAVRALFRNDSFSSYDSVDVSIYSSHFLADGVKTMAYERRPYTVCYIVTNDGELVALVYNKEQNTIAWSKFITSGVVESVAAVPDPGGNDVTYLSVFRDDGGTLKRYIERLDNTAGAGKYDSGVTIASAGATTITGLGHLDGATVAACGDGIYLGTYTVSGGQITLANSPGPQSVNVGLPYTATVTLQAPEVGTGTGTAQGQSQSTNRVWVRMLESIGLTINGTDVSFRNFDSMTLDSAIAPFTGIKELSTYGWAVGESDLVLEQRQGMPWTILSVVRNFTVNPS